jgi:pathogenesis-related protein 1
MTRWFWASALFAALLVGGCGSDDDGGEEGGTSSAGRGGGSSGSGARGGTSSTSGGSPGRGGASSSGSESCAEPADLAGITAAHNEVRSSVDTDTPLPALEWSCEIAAVAQAYADELASRGCPLEHSKNDYGENLYWASGGNPTAADAVRAWASEERCYTYGPFPNTCSGDCLSCGHYTQIVWRESTKLGCGRASCDRQQVWVCNYDPPGNFLGKRPY